ncbi:hypothetical protein [Phenylobacterium sp.]|uniref:hypothetical protein n=1 Tax=Phenylobacterium sp. TaxID=1871053 RepID=UPI0025CC58E7|nr:hypothetical protein [Phenylobacterium sp.]
MRLLIHERSYARVRAAVDAAPALELVLIDDDGHMTVAGAPVTPDEAAPDLAWANTDTFFTGAGRNFMAATLKSPNLKWVQSGAAGFDNPAFGKIVQKGARLTPATARRWAWPTM